MNIEGGATAVAVRGLGLGGGLGEVGLKVQWSLTGRPWQVTASGSLRLACEGTAKCHWQPEWPRSASPPAGCVQFK